MSTPTLTPTGLPGDDRDPQGYRDGELAAITGLPRDRARAITAMAADHDPAYATAYWHGYLTVLVVLILDHQDDLLADLAAYESTTPEHVR